MNFSQFLLIIKARKKLILFIFLFFVILVFALCLVLPKKYSATTSIVVNYKGVDPVTGLSTPAQLMPGFMATQVDIITSHSVAVKVVQNLGLSNSPSIKEQFQTESKGLQNIDDWLAGLLTKSLEVKPSRESSIIEVSYSGADPQFAAAIANAFAEAYQEASLRLKVEPSRKAADYLLVQSKQYREKLEAAQVKLSKYQQENGLTSIAENLDVENAKLNQLANQLIVVQAQALDSSSRKANANAAGDASPDIASSPVIQNLKVAIAQANSKLAEVGNRFGTNHPQYLSAQAEFEKLKSQLELEVTRIGSSVGGSARIYQQNEALLKSALAAQKQKVLDLNRSRDQMSVLQRDVETAQAAYNAVSSRLNQTSLEGKSNESDVSILNIALPPTEPSSPKTIRNLLLASVLGLWVGIGVALLLEIKNRRIRSRHDINSVFDAPIFTMASNKYKANKTPNKLAFSTKKLSKKIA